MAVAHWAGCGAMALTGDRDGPPRVEPAAVAGAATAAAEAVAQATARWGRRLLVDGPAILGERAAIAGLSRQGSTSVGGAASFVAAVDGWVVLNLPRREDVASLPALVGADVDPARWSQIARRLAEMPAAEISERAHLLGLAAAVPHEWSSRPSFGPEIRLVESCNDSAGEFSAGEFSDAAPGPGHCVETALGGSQPGVLGALAPARVLDLGARRSGDRRLGARRLGDRRPGSGPARPVVVDMTSLWAGPLAGSLLAAAGARVIKVEGANRPDGARLGPSAFFDLLNAGKECVALDFETREGRRLLLTLMTAADLVLEGSRPRVMERLGIDPAALCDAGTSWLSINGYGRSGPDAQRIAFGDDAAVAAGLLVEGPAPGFVADAVADPLTGLVAAATGAAMLAADRAMVTEVPLVEVARWAGGPVVNNEVVRDGSGWSVVVGADRVPVAAPAARRMRRRAVASDAHTEAVASELRWVS